MARYVKISPRGFSNETCIAKGTAEQVRKLVESYDSDPNGYAYPLKESSPEVRKLKREAKRYREPIAYHIPDLQDEIATADGVTAAFYSIPNRPEADHPPVC